MWTLLLQHSWVRMIGIAVLCLSLGYMRGCSTGQAKGEAKVQTEFTEYQLKVASDLIDANAKVITIVQERAKAQNELALLQSKRRDDLREEIVDVKRKLEGFRIKLDDNCAPTDSELRVVQEAIDKARTGARKN